MSKVQNAVSRIGVNVTVAGLTRRVKVLRPYSQRVPAVEGIMEAAKKGFPVASNRIIDATLNGGELKVGQEWEAMQEVFPVWTGTMVGYQEPGKPLGNQIIYIDPGSRRHKRWVFPVPEAFRGEKDAALATDPPYYALVMEGHDVVVTPTDTEKVGLVTGFPGENGWYNTDPVFGLPCGVHVNLFNPVSLNLAVRRLWRLAGARVGPVARGSFENGRDVVLYVLPSGGLGVAIETPLEGGRENVGANL